MANINEQVTTNKAAAAADVSIDCRKRKSDAIERLALTNQLLVQHKDVSDRDNQNHNVPLTGRGSISGWTECPLCGPCSKKKHALGRGIAAHLQAVHTPWKPSKIEQKKHYRIMMRQQAVQHQKQQKVGNSGNQSLTKVPVVEPLQEWEPSTQEIVDWEEKVLKIVWELELQAYQANHKDTRQTTTIPPGKDRNGQEVTSYRKSLPEFIQYAADGNLHKLQSMVNDMLKHDNGNDGVMRLLNTTDRHLSTADHWAAGEGHLECLKYLLKLRHEYACKEGENLINKRKVRRRDGKNALHYAARKGQLECAKYLIEECNFLVDELAGDGTTPLHLACFGGHLKIVEYLLAYGANLKHVNDWGCSPAHWVAMSKSNNESELKGVCKRLMKNGVDFVETQKQGHTPLHKAAQHQNKMFIYWFLSSHEMDGLGLSIEDKRRASLPDDGGHDPIEIWKNAGGDEDLTIWMMEQIKR